MPRPKKEPATTPADAGHVIVAPKKPTDWMALLRGAATNHWRTLRLTIQLRDKLHAGKPRALNAAEAMIAARGLGDVLEAKRDEKIATASPEQLDEQVAAAQEVGVCEFSRRRNFDGTPIPGLWMPANNLKAMLKENWSVLGLRVENRGSRGALAEGVFVYGAEPPPHPDADWIRVSPRDEPDGMDESVVHAIGPQGPRTSIKRNEFVLRPTITITVWIAQAIADKLPDADLARTFYHAGEHGMGANRSQGLGKFDVVAFEELTQEAAK